MARAPPGRALRTARLRRPVGSGTPFPGFTTGYQANLGLISGLCNADDVVLLDVESHASIYDGARLSGAHVFAFRHNSAPDLARKLAKQPEGGRCLVVVEGLYSI